MKVGKRGWAGRSPAQPRFPTSKIFNFFYRIFLFQNFLFFLSFLKSIFHYVVLFQISVEIDCYGGYFPAILVYCGYMIYICCIHENVRIYDNEAIILTNLRHQKIEQFLINCFKGWKVRGRAYAISDPPLYNPWETIRNCSIFSGCLKFVNIASLS